MLITTQNFKKLHLKLKEIQTSTVTFFLIRMHRRKKKKSLKTSYSTVQGNLLKNINQMYQKLKKMYFRLNTLSCIFILK